LILPHLLEQITSPPPAPDLTKLKFGTAITLFNGKDLSGWKLTNEKQKNGFYVKEGILANNPVQTEGALISVMEISGQKRYLMILI